MNYIEAFVAQFSLSNVHKRGLRHHHFIYMEVFDFLDISKQSSHRYIAIRFEDKELSWQWVTTQSWCSRRCFAVLSTKLCYHPLSQIFHLKTLFWIMSCMSKRLLLGWTDQFCQLSILTIASKILSNLFEEGWRHPDNTNWFQHSIEGLVSLGGVPRQEFLPLIRWHTIGIVLFCIGLPFIKPLLNLYVLLILKK